MSLTLWKSPRLKFQIGREAHANVGSCVSAYSCDHGSHGRLWCACFSSKGALCVRCMAEIGPCRELPPSPDAPGGGPRCTSRSPSPNHFERELFLLPVGFLLVSFHSILANIFPLDLAKALTKGMIKWSRGLTHASPFEKKLTDETIE